MSRRNVTKRVDIRIRESLYKELRAYASRNGEQVEIVLDGLIARWLDERIPRA